MPLRSGVTLVAILAMFASPSFCAQSVTGGVKVGANFSKIVLKKKTRIWNGNLVSSLALHQPADDGAVFLSP